MNVLMVSNRVKTYALGFENVIVSFIELGHKVIWAADFSGFIDDNNIIPCETRQISITSNPIKVQNVRAYNELLQIIDRDQIDAIYCSTPIGGTLARMAARKMCIELVIYAAHGFLFFEGAPLVNKILFKFHEKLLAKWTDVLITITNEDYVAAEKFRLRSGKKPYLVHGAGVNVGNYIVIDKEVKRKELGVPTDGIVLVSGGFLNRNKNNRVIIEAMGFVANDNIYYLICGEGKEENALKSLAKKCGVDKKVAFLGYRKDLLEIMAVSDIFVMPSLREGVPRSLLEAMDLGMPCIGARTRGITELIGNDGGYLCRSRSSTDFATAIDALARNIEVRLALGKANREKVKMYSTECVKMELMQIFDEVLTNA